MGSLFFVLFTLITVVYLSTIYKYQQGECIDSLFEEVSDGADRI
ncbi:hypothetical protein SAMN05660830_00908 [Halodesulfovibrio aestuarii]|uniref:Uncharacterized protein n=1 Tax=Halodesulfovibrio aestuarii TaxID=126333 RepID=A0A8G2C861_9BACT|nr:hypothetical protein SAMN05660830_00908 [Halodesulfovibrio aestuarii]